MFIPPGYVLLTAAVDRLAEARRTSGQANDHGKNAAREKLQGEFYSDTISPLVVSRSGKSYKIWPYHWGNDELAPTWFEQGECLLTDGLVDPPLRMFQGEERANIFVSEHDLQRLMAKQEVKQEFFTSDPIADVEAREKDTGGRSPEPVNDALCSTYQQSGLPGRPTSKQLLLDKLNERIAANLIEPTLERETAWLRKWLAEKHPKAPPSGQSAIKNSMRETYNKAKKTT